MVKRISKRGFTLVELMIVVAIVGVLAALAIYGVRKYIANAKTAEARNSVGQMAKDASSAYQREQTAGTIVTIGNSTTAASNSMCASAAAPVPAAMSAVQGKKYQSSPAEWKTGSQSAGWQCLKFSMADPQYYQYNYAITGTGSATGDTFTATAQGDLNGDGTTFSAFSLTGQIQAAGGTKELTVAPNITETNPEE